MPAAKPHKRRRPREIDGSSVSPRAILDSADAFYRLASHYIDRIPTDLAAAKAFADNFGDLVASATNLILAAELYLKTFLAAGNFPVPTTHDLVDLFDRLRDDWRNKIEAAYEARRSALDQRATSTLTLYAQLGDQPDLDKRVAPALPLDQRLALLLERNRTAFEMWRYVHEEMKSESVTAFSYEFRALKVFCDLLREILIASAPGIADTQRRPLAQSRAASPRDDGSGKN